MKLHGRCHRILDDEPASGVDQYLNRLSDTEEVNVRALVECKNVTVVSPELHNLLPFLDAFDVVRVWLLSR